MKDRIIELAREDAQSDIYMGNKFLALQRAEVRKMAPDRAALMRMFDPERLAKARRFLPILSVSDGMRKRLRQNQKYILH